MEMFTSPDSLQLDRCAVQDTRYLVWSQHRAEEELVKSSGEGRSFSSYVPMKSFLEVEEEVCVCYVYLLPRPSLPLSFATPVHYSRQPKENILISSEAANLLWCVAICCLYPCKGSLGMLDIQKH